VPSDSTDNQTCASIRFVEEVCLVGSLRLAVWWKIIDISVVSAAFIIRALPIVRAASNIAMKTEAAETP
jgi:hypothetical protein